MTTTDDFSNPFASADDEPSTSAPEPAAASEADAESAALGESEVADAEGLDAPVDDADPVIEIAPAETIELPGEAEILEVTDLEGEDDEVVEAEPSPYDRPGR